MSEERIAALEAKVEAQAESMRVAWETLNEAGKQLVYLMEAVNMLTDLLERRRR